MKLWQTDFMLATDLDINIIEISLAGSGGMTQEKKSKTFEA